nr:M1 family metallopeptidase [Nocardioides daedukensis]
MHYDLDLSWDPVKRVLTGTAEIAFRSTKDQAAIKLDFDDHLQVTQTTLDGDEVEVVHRGKDLTVKAAVQKDGRHLLTITYTGTPEPWPAPTDRGDFSTTGFTITETGDVWTMQEPHGAFTWYPVNDQPADKAFYDFTITTNAPRVGVANGQLVERTEVDGKSIAQWHLDSAASSYLITIAIADYEMTEDKTPSGVPLTYWTEPGNAAQAEAMAYTPEAIEFLEGYLGPFPFSSMGSVVVASQSAMETQQMITYGNTAYTLSNDVVVHEVAHQWYGDIVSPSDWRDVWMNEGMAMYLQLIHEAEVTGRSLDQLMDAYADPEASERKEAGPPGDYDPTKFGRSNIYYGPALMWHELRKQLGDEKFWAMVKKWPTVDPMGNPTRKEYLDWVEKETGEELSDFFDGWLNSPTTPKRS